MSHAACALSKQATPRESPTLDALAAEWRVWGFRLALKITGCPEAAEDALQEALLRAFKHAKNLHEPAAAQAWFRKIVVRCAMNQLPSKNLALEVDAHATERDANLDEQIQVRNTLGQLKPAHRAILALALGEQLSYEEIAGALGIAPGTVGSRLHAAKEEFRKKWGEEK